MRDSWSRTAAILSLVCGVASIGLAFVVPYISVASAIAGVALGRNTRWENRTGRAGFICSIIGLVLFAVVVAIAYLYAINLPPQR